MSNSTLEFKVIRVHRLPENGRMKAFVDMAVSDQLLLKGLRIVDGKNGLFVSMPQEKGKDNRWYNSVDCLSDETRKEISAVVLSAYRENH